MRYSPDMQIDRLVGPRDSPKPTQETSAMLLRDRQDCVPLRNILTKDDIIVLLTPVVVPYNRHAENDRDPFEPLGRAIASRHALIRHVPYTKRGGINKIHSEFIRRAKAVIFVVSGPAVDGDVSQLEMAETARTLADEQPQILVACCELQAEDIPDEKFPTIVQVAGYTPSELETAASIMFGEYRPQPINAVPVQNLVIAPQHWPVEVCGQDMTPIHQLWTECLPPKYHLPQFALVLLLRRDGYAMNYIVREPETKQIVGFCATYTTYTDSDQESLLGSLAMLLVKSAYRGRGIGLSLHNFALKQLQRIRGVRRLQLGSAFPRLLYGVPSDSFAKEWFGRRDWQMNGNQPGQGIEATDWLLKFEDMPVTSLSSAGLTFRRCDFMEFHPVLQIVDRDAVRKGNMGWYDQYARLDGTPHIEDVIIGLEGETIVAIALTYIPNSGSPIDEDLPWAKTIGMDVGGVTCICITGSWFHKHHLVVPIAHISLDDNREMVNSRDSVMIRLLDTCVKMLAERGMRQMFIDAVKGGNAGFQSLGFREWARYKDVWRKV